MITIDSSTLKDAQYMLSACPGRIKKAAVSAVNRTMTHLRKEVSVDVRSRYIVKAADVKKTLSLHRASVSNPFSSLKSTGRAPLLSAFRVTGSKSKPMSVQVLRTGGKKPVRGMFSGVAKSGYKGLMMRGRQSRAPRYPLSIPHGPSVPQMIGTQPVMSRIMAEGERYLNARFLHEVSYQLAKFEGKL